MLGGQFKYLLDDKNVLVFDSLIACNRRELAQRCHKSISFVLHVEVAADFDRVGEAFNAECRRVVVVRFLKQDRERGKVRGPDVLEKRFDGFAVVDGQKVLIAFLKDLGFASLEKLGAHFLEEFLLALVACRRGCFLFDACVLIFIESEGLALHCFVNFLDELRL